MRAASRQADVAVDAPGACVVMCDHRPGVRLDVERGGRVHDEQIPVWFGGQEHPVAGDRPQQCRTRAGRRRWPCLVTLKTPCVSVRMTGFADVQTGAGLPAELRTTAWSATRPRQSTASSPYTHVLMLGVGTDGRSAAWTLAPSRARRRGVSGMTTGLITEPVTTNTPTGSDGGAMTTLNQRDGVPLSTGTFDVAGMPRKCVRGRSCTRTTRLLLP
jgi:hypothetical protein